MRLNEEKKRNLQRLAEIKQLQEERQKLEQDLSKQRIYKCTFHKHCSRCDACLLNGEAHICIPTQEYVRVIRHFGK